jgi:hypothetical protein
MTSNILSPRLSTPLNHPQPQSHSKDTQHPLPTNPYTTGEAQPNHAPNHHPSCHAVSKLRRYHHRQHSPQANTVRSQHRRPEQDARNHLIIWLISRLYEWNVGVAVPIQAERLVSVVSDSVEVYSLVYVDDWWAGLEVGTANRHAGVVDDFLSVLDELGPGGSPFGAGGVVDGVVMCVSGFC